MKIYPKEHALPNPAKWKQFASIANVCNEDNKGNPACGQIKILLEAKATASSEKQIKESGLAKSDIQLPMATIEKVVEQYTNESGVRGLEKKVAKIVRNRAKEMAMKEPYKTEVKPDDLNYYIIRYENENI